MCLLPVARPAVVVMHSSALLQRGPCWFGVPLPLLPHENPKECWSQECWLQLWASGVVEAMLWKPWPHLRTAVRDRLQGGTRDAGCLVPGSHMGVPADLWPVKLWLVVAALS